MIDRPADPMRHPLLKQLMAKRTEGKGEPVRWKGSEHPRGVQWGDVTLENAEHGILRDAGGRDVGSYRRVSEFSGPDSDEHEILAWPRPRS